MRIVVVVVAVPSHGRCRWPIMDQHILLLLRLLFLCRLCLLLWVINQILVATIRVVIKIGQTGQVVQASQLLIGSCCVLTGG